MNFNTLLLHCTSCLYCYLAIWFDIWPCVDEVWTTSNLSLLVRMRTNIHDYRNRIFTLEILEKNIEGEEAIIGEEETCSILTYCISFLGPYIIPEFTKNVCFMTNHVASPVKYVWRRIITYNWKARTVPYDIARPSSRTRSLVKLPC